MDKLHLIGTVAAVVGGVAAVVSAFVAVKQARNAKSYRDEIFDVKKRTVLLELLPEANKARDACKSLTTPVNKPHVIPEGVDEQRMIDTISDCLDRVKDNAHNFGNKKIGNAANLAAKFVAEYISKNPGLDRFQVADDMKSAIGKLISAIREAMEYDGVG
ncbi:hypothetical protein Pan258_54140 [Symmachiella dynata]|uniref:hypothetical protein n=1 Tax=Symmachiella dynata TaxID=2527995 RepID=UPI001189ED73|nr:hypothetical protein [Symmachiella dynata]QDT51325.1 hypothetical protein Pan258_54140 [Symmachiella dynata]